MPPETELFERVCGALRGIASRGDGVAFSGGVDSSLVASAARECGLEPVLVTVGFAGSRDMRFAPHIARMMNLKHCARVIGAGDVMRQSGRVDSIVGECTMSWRENCIAFALLSEFGASLGLGRIVTANGIDELFCGYNAYRTIEQEEHAILAMMRDKLDNEAAMMRAVNDMTAEYGITIAQPLLTDTFVEYAMGVPLEQKITGAGDLLRKHLVRSTAEQFGVPSKSAYSRKKALQYGTGIHAALVAGRGPADRAADRVNDSR